MQDGVFVCEMRYSYARWGIRVRDDIIICALFSSLPGENNVIEKSETGKCKHASSCLTFAFSVFGLKVDSSVLHPRFFFGASLFA